MKKILILLLIFSSSITIAQEDYSELWEDFFSYNNVKDFVKTGQTIYALTDNAIFTYNILNQEIKKLSSVQGLSGETTKSIQYSSETNKLVIGYENGLLEVVDSDGSITSSSDIVTFNQSGEKSINHLFEHQGTLYLSTSFAIVEYDINQLEFGDTFFIGNNSTDVKVNEITVFNDRIYAATNNGIYIAELDNPNLIDFNNWEMVTFGNGIFKNITVFNTKIYTILDTQLFELKENGDLQFIIDYFEPVKGMKASSTNLSVAFNNSVIVYDQELIQILENTADSNFDYTLNTAIAENNELYLATNLFGVLTSPYSDVTNFEEIHPEGPISNDVFSVSAKNNELWIVYGGFGSTYGPIQRKLGFTHFDGESWFTAMNDPLNPFPDLVDVAIHPTNNNKVFISGFGDTTQIDTFNTGGLFEVENDEITTFFNNLNSPLEDIVGNIANRVTIRIPDAAFDFQENLWVLNIGVPYELKKFSNGSWSEFDISAGKPENSFGLSEIAVDRNNTVWIGTRADGVVAFNENGNRVKGLTTLVTQGSLPNAKVESIAVDKDNRIWIGTISGMVVFNNASGVFDEDTVDAQPVIFEEDGVAKKLLGDQYVSTIEVDGANNKWFGTDNGGAIYTNPNGQTTLATFNTQNSPLPSNKIIKIAVDNQTGKVYFATNKGVVAYNSNVAPFGETLGEVYAYPNPARKFHNSITIDGRDGTNLPKGTNVKILDIAGNLVFETNVIEGQQLQGGKVIWDKTNLAGNNVASGVYIVLLSSEDATETSTTKIAIIN